jgi:hypothetical protein
MLVRYQSPIRGARIAKTSYRFLVLLIATIALAACANWQGLLDEQSAKYVGQPVDIVYASWASPRGGARKSDGGRFLEFSYSRGNFWCHTSLETDSTDRVIRINRVTGPNGCAMGWLL